MWPYSLYFAPLLSVLSGDFGHLVCQAFDGLKEKVKGLKTSWVAAETACHLPTAERTKTDKHTSQAGVEPEG